MRTKTLEVLLPGCSWTWVQLYQKSRKDCLDSLTWLFCDPRIPHDPLPTRQDIRIKYQDKSVKELREIIQGMAFLLTL